MDVFATGMDWNKIWNDSKIQARTVNLERTLKISASAYRQGGNPYVLQNQEYTDRGISRTVPAGTYKLVLRRDPNYTSPV